MAVISDLNKQAKTSFLGFTVDAGPSCLAR